MTGITDAGTALRTLNECLGLVEVDLSELQGLEYLGAGTLSRCHNLKNVLLPPTVERVNHCENPEMKNMFFSFVYADKNLKINDEIGKFYLYGFRDEYPEDFFS